MAKLSNYQRAYDYAMQNGVGHDSASTRASAADGLLMFHDDPGLQLRLLQLGFTPPQVRSLLKRRVRNA